MRKIILLMGLLIILTFVGCGSKDSDIPKKDTEKDKKIIAEDFTSDIGYILENNVYDYSICFDKVYEWTEGVKLPFDKPLNANISWVENSLSIGDVDKETFDEYLEELKKEGFSVIEKKYEDIGLAESVTARYVLYKDNLIVIMDKYTADIRVHITTGNVVGERSVSIEKLREMLDKEYKDDMIIEISHKTVAEAGYCEFLVISEEHYISTDLKNRTNYVIANEQGILLCKKGIWNQAYPMTVILQDTEEGRMLTINYNSIIGANSGQSVYPGCTEYILKENEFVVNKTNSLVGDNVVVGILENELIKYYILKRNEEIDTKNGKKTRWIIDTEYNMNNCIGE